MQLGTSYREITKISFPIMLGSAVQQIIALSDSVFLFHVSLDDFGAIGFVSVFYLMIAAIGFGFSKGGQIMIARRMGEEQEGEVGRTFYAMLYFELALALLLFLFMQFGSYYLFALFTDSDVIFYKMLEYLDYRSWGVFFSFSGLAIIAMYTGVARTSFIVIDSIILALVNVVLNYGLIYGKWGLPEMGIGGAGLASTIAELVALILFVAYIFYDKKYTKGYQLFKLPQIDWELIKTQQKISSPVVAQAVVGFGSWFFFFGLIENLGERPLAITNLARIVYLGLSIPCWGFASGANTIVSNFIGQNKREMVIPLLWKVSTICFVTTMILTIPLVCFPEYVLYPLFGSNEIGLMNGTDPNLSVSIITEARPVLWILAVILALFSVGGVFFNGLAGTGATHYALMIQIFATIFYIAYIVVVIKMTNAGLVWAWACEIFYWLLIFILTYRYLKSTKWHSLKV